MRCSVQSCVSYSLLCRIPEFRDCEFFYHSMTTPAVSLTLNPTCFFLCTNSSLLLSIVMQTVRVIDFLHFPVNEPLEQRIHPFHTLSTVYSSLKKHPTPLFNTITCTYGSFGHGGMGQLHGLFQFSSRSCRCDTSPVNHPEEYHHQSSQSLHARNSTCTPFLSLTHRRSTCSVQTASKEECTPSSHSHQVRRPFPSTTLTGPIHTTRAS